MESLQIFKNEEFGQVRVATINNEPWFVGKDVAQVLGYSNTSDALKKHVDEDDKGVAKCDTLGGKQSLTIINESGLYSLILSSKLPNAKKFKRWVTSEVLPTIRKHGVYATDDILEQAIANPDFMIGLLTNLKEEKEKRKQLEEKNKKLTTEIEHKEGVIVGLVKDIDLATKRQRIKQIINYGANGRFSERYNLLYKEFQDKYHMDLKRRMDNLTVRSTFINPNNENIKITKKLKTNKMEYIDRALCMIPELYEIACKIFENDVEELKKEWETTINRKEEVYGK